MANPFSGLENIGQSYLQGVQLAQQRQLREEAIAQRQEEARIRERYYQDIATERRAALDERRRARMDAAAAQFGQDLVLNAEGEPDYGASALKRDQRLQNEQLIGAEAELAGLQGTQPPLAPEIVSSPAYRAGVLRGTARKLAQENDLTTALIRRGYTPVGTAIRELPSSVEDQIQGIAAPDVFAGVAPMAAPASGAPRLRMAGTEFIPPAARSAKAEDLGTEEYEVDGRKIRIKLTPERAAELRAAQLAKPEKEPGMFDDIEAAEKELKRLASRGKDVEVNVYEDEQGNIKVRKDQFGFTKESVGLTPSEARKQLERLRTLRKEAAGETSEEAPKNRAEAAARARRVTPLGVLRNLPALPQRVPVAAPTNAIPAIVNSMAPAGPSAEDLRSLDPEELAQALAEARTQGIDPGQLGLQLRQALQEAGVPTAAGTNSMPLGMIPGSFDQIMRLPRGRIPVEL